MNRVRIALLRLLLAGLVPGCASGPSADPERPAVPRQEVVNSDRGDAKPEAREPAGSPLRRAAENVAGIACGIVSIPLYPLSTALILHEYDKAEREGGILP